MSCGFGLPPALKALDCFLTRLGAMPCRRRAARSAASSGARLLPFTRLPFLSMPSHWKAMSRLALLIVAVAAGAMLNLSYVNPGSFRSDAVHFFEAREP